MWPFSRKYALGPSGFFRDWTDWHCHILPGVDDGIRTMEDALKVLSFYADLGVREVWLTPHVMEDVPNTPVGLRSRFAELLAAYRGPIHLHLAAENMLDNLFEERFAAGEVLPLGERGDTLLVETSYYNPPMDLDGLLRRISREGFRPLLAHPERYVYMDMKDYHRLRENGVEFQLNLFSLTGHYGPEARKKALLLLNKGFYGRTGSDLHRLRAFQAGIAEKSLSKSEIALLENMNKQ